MVKLLYFTIFITFSANICAQYVYPNTSQNGGMDAFTNGIAIPTPQDVMRQQLGQMNNYSAPKPYVPDPYLEAQQIHESYLRTYSNEVPVVNTPINPFSEQEMKVIDSSVDRIYTAFHELIQLLNNPSHASLADAFYSLETAYGGNYLSKKDYLTIIDNSTKFIKKWMKQNNLNINSQDDLHQAIQDFISKKLVIKDVAKGKDGKLKTITVEHLPFYYDFSDFKGVEDRRNTFVTKALATGTGQCVGLPRLYLLLAEKLGAISYLSQAPNHNFIKFKNSKGEIENYEPTSNWRMSNQWYQDYLQINERAIKSGIYMDTLNKQKIIADCLSELGLIYMIKIPRNKSNFLAKLLTEIDKYYPNNSHGFSFSIYESYLETLLSYEIFSKNLKTTEDIMKDPKANQIQQIMINNNLLAKEKGYIKLPYGMYEQIMYEQEFKGKKQEELDIDYKKKRNLFQTIR